MRTESVVLNIVVERQFWVGLVQTGEKMLEQFLRRRPISRLTNQYQLARWRKPQTAKMEGENKIFGRSVEESYFGSLTIPETEEQFWAEQPQFETK